MLIFIIILSGLAALSLFLVSMLIHYLINQASQFHKNKLQRHLKIAYRNVKKSHDKQETKPIIICELCGTPLKEDSAECPFCRNKI